MALFAAFCLAAAPMAVFGDSGKIHGQVFDREGRPLSGAFVELIEKPTGIVLPLPGRERSSQERVVSRVSTDEAGFFQLDFHGDPKRSRVFLRVGRNGTWDRLRYLSPDGRDVTEELRRAKTAYVTFLIEDAPGWSELSRGIARVGGVGTDRGRVLRRHGWPSEVIDSADGTEWRYARRVYRFTEEGKLLEVRGASSRDGGQEGRDREMGSASVADGTHP